MHKGRKGREQGRGEGSGRPNVHQKSCLRNRSALRSLFVEAPTVARAPDLAQAGGTLLRTRCGAKTCKRLSELTVAKGLGKGDEPVATRY